MVTLLKGVSMAYMEHFNRIPNIINLKTLYENRYEKIMLPSKYLSVFDKFPIPV